MISRACNARPSSSSYTSWHLRSASYCVLCCADTRGLWPGGHPACRSITSPPYRMPSSCPRDVGNKFPIFEHVTMASLANINTNPFHSTKTASSHASLLEHPATLKALGHLGDFVGPQSSLRTRSAADSITELFQVNLTAVVRVKGRECTQKRRCRVNRRM